jgi:sugar lactone lactonase YvrE
MTDILVISSLYQNMSYLHKSEMIVRPITSNDDQVGESPVWSVREQALYWVDIERKLIRRTTVSGEAVKPMQWILPERVACIALTAEPYKLIAAMQTQIAAVTLRQDGSCELEVLAHINHPAAGMRFNDGRCDAAGRLWVSTMVMDMSQASAQGGMYCLDERGLTGPYITDLITPNGSGFSPDGRIFYISDSHPTVQKIWAYDFDAYDAKLSHRRLFADMTDMPGRPDGAAIDTQGRYWICGNDAGKIHCFNHDGSLARSVEVPTPKPSMCAFGGADLGTLYVASIKPAQIAESDVVSGSVLALRVEAKGMSEPLFSRFP